MKLAPLTASRPLLDWVLGKGRNILSFQVRNMDGRYVVSVLTPGNPDGAYERELPGSRLAFQLHAALVSEFRNDGWQSVAYRTR